MLRHSCLHPLCVWSSASVREADVATALPTETQGIVIVPVNTIDSSSVQACPCTSSSTLSAASTISATTQNPGGIVASILAAGGLSKSSSTSGSSTSIETTASSSTSTFSSHYVSQTSESLAIQPTTRTQLPGSSSLTLPAIVLASSSTTASILTSPTFPASEASSLCTISELEAIALFCSTTLATGWAESAANGITVSGIHAYVEGNCIASQAFAITFADCLIDFVNACTSPLKENTMGPGNCQTCRLDQVSYN